jgi:protein-tyrosine kinase
MSRIEEALEKANKLRGTGNIDAAPAEAASAAVNNFAGTTPPIRVDNPYLLTITEPDSPVTEEFRKLKSVIVNITKKGTFKNALMVTSSVAGEGKSLTALNLAITLAQEYDHTVLLVDADLRQPSITDYLGIPPQTGLSDCLSNGNDVGSVLIKTGIGKLMILSAGSRVSNPVELLSSNKMKVLLKELKHRYSDRYIIIDTPPVLPFAEAHAIGSMVDGVIFVVKERHAPVGSIKDALSALKDMNILGVVYNDVDVEHGDSYYRYYNYRANYKKGLVSENS